MNYLTVIPCSCPCVVMLHGRRIDFQVQDNHFSPNSHTFAPDSVPPAAGRPSAVERLSAIRIPSAAREIVRPTKRPPAIRRPPIVGRASAIGRASAAVGNKDMVLAASAAATCFPQAEIGPMGNNDARQGSSAGFHRFPPQPHAPGKKEKPPPGVKKPSTPLAAGKSSCQGRRKPSAPLAAGKNSCRGQRRPSAPLADKTNGCPGRERGLAPLVVMVFVVRWTRWDFRGCTWYTEYGSEGLLGLGQWTWCRPSKWTWSTKGCQSNGNGRVKNVN